jgi:hypothetical protein
MGRSPEAMKVLLWRALQELKERFGDTESLGLPDRCLDEGAEGGGGGPRATRGGGSATRRWATSSGPLRTTSGWPL